jgi:hypothetical protein
MTDTVTSQHIDFSSWDILYKQYKAIASNKLLITHSSLILTHIYGPNTALFKAMLLYSSPLPTGYLSILSNHVIHTGIRWIFYLHRKYSNLSVNTVAIHYSETSANFCRIALCHMPEVGTLKKGVVAVLNERSSMLAVTSMAGCIDKNEK